MAKVYCEQIGIRIRVDNLKFGSNYSVQCPEKSVQNGEVYCARSGEKCGILSNFSRPSSNPSRLESLHAC